MARTMAGLAGLEGDKFSVLAHSFLPLQLEGWGLRVNTTWLGASPLLMAEAMVAEGWMPCELGW